VAEATLSTRTLNRALLARQLLLERSEAGLVEAVESIGGLQTQYAPSAYVGLWSRLADFQRDSLTQALHDKSVVQATLMRSTIHIVSTRDFPCLAAAIRRGRREWWTRVAKNELGDLDMDEVVERLRYHFASGLSKAGDLAAALAADGYPPVAWNGVGMWVDLVRVPPSGTWEKRRADRYATARDWLGVAQSSEEEGLDLLVRRYLGAFGPASVADLAAWSGLPVGFLRPALSHIELRRFLDEQGGELIDLPSAPLPDTDTPAPVRFLPTWDATLLVHARRTQILPEQYRPLVFNTKTPHSFATFLVDGAVAGTWRYEGRGIKLEPFAKLSKRVIAELHEEAERLARFHTEGR